MANDTTRSADQQLDAPPPRGWTGLVSFAAFMLILVGGFHVIGGFVALLEEDHYQVGSSALMISVEYNTWGWVHITLGVLMGLAGAALFLRRSWGRVVAVLVAAFSAITNLAFLSAAPVWYSLMIVMDILIIYAVTVYGGREPDYDY